jgi:hypothetical protein
MISHPDGLLIQIIRHRFEYYRFKIRNSTGYRNRDVCWEVMWVKTYNLTA